MPGFTNKLRSNALCILYRNMYTLNRMNRIVSHHELSCKKQSDPPTHKRNLCPLPITIHICHYSIVQDSTLHDKVYHMHQYNALHRLKLQFSAILNDFLSPPLPPRCHSSSPLAACAIRGKKLVHPQPTVVEILSR